MFKQHLGLAGVKKGTSIAVYPNFSLTCVYKKRLWQKAAQKDKQSFFVLWTSQSGSVFMLSRPDFRAGSAEKAQTTRAETRERERSSRRWFQARRKAIGPLDATWCHFMPLVSVAFLFMWVSFRFRLAGSIRLAYMIGTSFQDSKIRFSVVFWVFSNVIVHTVWDLAFEIWYGSFSLKLIRHMLMILKHGLSYGHFQNLIAQMV